MNFQDSLAEYLQKVEDILTKSAKDKGYANDNGGRDFFDSVNSDCPGHAAGEIRYKMRRWYAKKDPTDLIKVAAWAFLIWDQNNRSQDDKEKTPDKCQHPGNWSYGPNSQTICQYGECRCTCVVCFQE